MPMQCCGTAGSGNVFSGASADEANVTPVSNTTATMHFSGVEFDTDSYFNLAADDTKLTIPADGYYLIGFNDLLAISTGVSSPMFLDNWIETNGINNGCQASFTVNESNYVDNAGISASKLVHLAAGDVLTLVTHFFKAGTVTCQISYWLWIEKVG